MTKEKSDNGYKGHFFGLELNKFLVSRNLIETELQRAMERNGFSVTRQFINMLVRNDRAATPDMIKQIAQAMQLSREERQRLHRAAAIDAGYEIGGTR